MATKYFKISYDTSYPDDYSGWTRASGVVYKVDQLLTSKTETGLKACLNGTYDGLYQAPIAYPGQSIGVCFAGKNPFSRSLSSIDDASGIKVCYKYGSYLCGMDPADGQIVGCGSVSDVTDTARTCVRNVGSSDKSLGYVSKSGTSYPDGYSGITQFVDGVRYSGQLGKHEFTAVPKSGCAFVRWEGNATSVSGSKCSIDADSQVDYEVTAVFGRKYSISYDRGEGASGDMQSSQFVEGVSQKLPACGFSRTGYSFAGWSTSAGGDVEYGDGDVVDLDPVAPGAVIVLYAVWRKVWFDLSVSNSRPEAGSIVMIAGGEVVAEENDGSVFYSGEPDGRTYVVEGRPNGRLFVPLGVDGVDPFYYIPSEGETVAKTFEWRDAVLRSLVLHEGMSATVSPDPDKDGKWVDGTVVAISVTPPAGHYFSSYSIRDEVSGNVLVTDNAPSDGVVRATMNTDISFNATFKPMSYSVAASVDSASEGAGSASVSVDGHPPAEKTEYGKTAVFTAQPNDGYSFVGWFDGDVIVSSSSAYERTVDGDIDLVARFACVVSFSFDYVDNAGTSPARDAQLFVDGSPVSGDSSLELGKTHSYEVVPGSWHFCNVVVDGEIAPLEKSGEIVPSAPSTFAVKVTSREVVNTLYVATYAKKDGGAETVSGYRVVLPQFVNPAITSEVDNGRPSPGLQGAPIAYEFKYTGTRRVLVHAADECDGKPFGFFATISGDEWNVFSRSQDISILLNGDVSIFACYGSQAKVKVSIDYASGCDRTMGEIVLDGDKGPTSRDIMQLETAKLSVLNGNGYVFAGWYRSRDVFGAPALTGNESELKVVGETRLYAYFEKDTHAVYRWEGSSENKMMEWRSRLYTFPRPLNPSAARVDSTGYRPLYELAVEMFSAPDTRPTSTMRISNMTSQSPRRLPAVRPERYMQVCVKNTEEVDMVAVDTSMGGLLS